MRRLMIAGNWKMHMTLEETDAFIGALRPLIRDSEPLDVLIVPPYTSLDRAAGALHGCPIELGAQDLHPEPKGAFTGAISGTMLVSCGCRYVLIGHSERRHVFGDTDDIVAKKLRTALAAGLRPILCVGETLDERRADRTEALLVRHLSTALAGLNEGELDRILIAYEPVWAIGTGETATPEQAQEATALIRSWAQSELTIDVAERVRILYGGSVKPENTRELVSQPDVDGALVGGASLDPRSFAAIIDEARG